MSTEAPRLRKRAKLILAKFFLFILVYQKLKKVCVYFVKKFFVFVLDCLFLLYSIIANLFSAVFSQPCLFCSRSMAPEMFLNNESSQAATSKNNTINEQSDLLEVLFQNMNDNAKPCKTYNLEQQIFDYDISSFFILHTNISSLQTHFDDFKEFLSNFSHPPYLILISETRIHLNPILNIEISNYTFTHVPSPTRAGGVMAYIWKELNFTVNDRLSLNIDGCDDLWLDGDIPGLKNNYTFAVIYRHPWNNHSTFLEALDSSMQALNSKGNKAVLLGDININLDSDVNVPHLTDYSHIIQSNAFLSLIDQPTRITSFSQTVIDHILTNDSVSTLIPGVTRYKLADHYPTFCIIFNFNFKYPRKESLFTFRKLASVNQNNFCNGLFSSLSPLHDRSTLACGNDLSPNAFNDHFTQVISAISAVIDKHAPLQKASRRQKRIQRNPWLSKGILTSIKQKQTLYRTHFLNGDALSINFFKTYSNKLTRVKSLSKKMY